MADVKHVEFKKLVVTCLVLGAEEEMGEHRCMTLQVTRDTALKCYNVLRGVRSIFDCTKIVTEIVEMISHGG